MSDSKVNILLIPNRKMYKAKIKCVVPTCPNHIINKFTVFKFTKARQPWLKILKNSIPSMRMIDSGTFGVCIFHFAESSLNIIGRNVTPFRGPSLFLEPTDRHRLCDTVTQVMDLIRNDASEAKFLEIKLTNKEKEEDADEETSDSADIDPDMPELVPQILEEDEVVMVNGKDEMPELEPELDLDVVFVGELVENITPQNEEKSLQGCLSDSSWNFLWTEPNYLM